MGSQPWTTVYQSPSVGDETLFAAFSPADQRERILRSDSWDLRIDGGMPGFMQSYEGDETVTTYLRYGTDDGIEPITLHQEHHGVLPEMLPQISEEVRLYHNLWASSDGTTLYSVGSDGQEEIAAEISHERVRIRTRLLRQFQAGRQLDLVLYVDSRVQVPTELTEVEREALTVEVQTDLLRYSVHAGSIRRGVTFSRLLGKHILPPPPPRMAGVWPYDEADEVFPEFIIGEDQNGRPIRFTCDHERLANYFGANPDAPHYLTPVFFRREVLQRYYERTDRYEVQDGRLSCGSLWGVQIDNDHPDHVMVFLGDLGRDLPEGERSYWVTFNVVPLGGMSQTAFRRSFLAQPTDPGAPDLQFKRSYDVFGRQWQSQFGWDLFRQPEEADAHVLQRLRVPLNGTQPEFEDQVLGLTKVLVDALNEKALVKDLGSKVEDEKGIDKFARWLTVAGYPEVDRDRDFLKRLQRLRSKSAAHRKGSDYQALLAREGVNSDLVSEVVMLFLAADAMLTGLAAHFLVQGDASEL